MRARRSKAPQSGPRVYVRGARRYPGAAGALKNATLAALAAAAPHVRGDVTVVLTDDAAIRRLNRDYRGSDKATDVLSFEISDGAKPEEPFGDVVISVETAARQARRYRARLEEEILRLLVHGTLHLCGHDHHERRSAGRMHGLTNRLLKSLSAV
ncbi:MAG TPA: rRNA maturation RNase YbeY [Candidatus Tumulicola sp.]|nr:rRNA maturation RNase YbeY [Candidatus Tumulicola sp.]